MQVTTSSKVEKYRELGYQSPNHAMSEAEALALRAKLEAHEAQFGTLKVLKPHLLFTWLDELVRNANILDAVTELIGSDILCWSSSFFTKEARSTAFVSWHQDANYIGLQPNEMVTAWIALTPSNGSNGALRIIPGSHHSRMPHQETYSSDNLLSRGQEIEVDVDEGRAVMLQLRPGEFSLHNALLIHGSDPNPSEERRIGFVVRYIPTHVRQTQSDRDTALLVRGTDRFGHFELERAPDGDFTPQVRAYHAKLNKGPHGLTPGQP
jgi:hypothetical protein